jgi:hypothetical protein
MRTASTAALLGFAAAALAACDSAESPAAPNRPEPAPTDAAASTPTPYRPVASVLDLMRGTVTMSAETYWESVSIVVDIEGEHVNQPEDSLEWHEVWSAGLTLAESGNLLMMPRDGLPDDPEWNRLAREFVEVGLRAAEAARKNDYEEVLLVGGYVRDSCEACHDVFVPTLNLF